MILLPLANAILRNTGYRNGEHWVDSLAGMLGDRIGPGWKLDVLIASDGSELAGGRQDLTYSYEQGLRAIDVVYASAGSLPAKYGRRRRLSS